jgi:ATP-dependent Clp protease ATP-binding subunit ClpA
VVFGQDAAIDHAGGRHQDGASGLAAEQKPIGSFLFAGPTGVGKTEVPGSSRVSLASS